MGILKWLFPGLFKEEKQEESLIVIEAPRQIAESIQLNDREQEYRDLNEKHSDFFDGKDSAILQLQSGIGANNGQTSVKITDVTPSRSDEFFKNAPEMKEEEDFEKVEKYMNVELHEEDEDNTSMVLVN